MVLRKICLIMLEMVLCCYATARLPRNSSSKARWLCCCCLQLLYRELDWNWTFRTPSAAFLDKLPGNLSTNETNKREITIFRYLREIAFEISSHANFEFLTFSGQKTLLGLVPGGTSLSTLTENDNLSFEYPLPKCSCCWFGADQVFVFSKGRQFIKTRISNFWRNFK